MMVVHYGICPICGKATAGCNCMEKLKQENEELKRELQHAKNNLKTMQMGTEYLIGLKDAQITKLKEALKPFADFVKWEDDFNYSLTSLHDTTRLTYITPEENSIRLVHCLTAYKLLEELE